MRIEVFWDAVIAEDLSIAVRHTFKFARNGDIIGTMS
jgi:hypothetical protein